MTKRKLNKYSLYIIVPMIIALIFLAGYLIGLSSANYAHRAEKESFTSNFVFENVTTRDSR